MTQSTGFRAGTLIAGALLAMSGAAAYAAQRTFVASGGNNANPCTLSAPCRSFDVAIAAADAGGEVIVLDSAGYGPATITKAVSVISPPGVYAGVSVASGTGVTISGTAGKVVLRGLSINGVGGTVGIDVQSSAEVHVENVVVSSMAGDGIKSFTDNAQLFVRDSTVRDNGGIGINLRAQVGASLDRVRIEANVGGGFFLDSGVHADARDIVVERNGDRGISVYNLGPAAATTVLTLANAMVARNTAGIITIANGAGVTARLTMSGCVVADHSLVGVEVATFNEALAHAFVFDTTLSDNVFTGMTANGAGVSVLVAGNNVVRSGGVGFEVLNGATIVTRGDNVLRENNGGGAQTFGTLTPLGATF